jgi:outer membrane protein assembly factor BamB
MNRKNQKLRFCFVFILFLCVTMDLLADDWPQWRGLNRDGKSNEKGLIKSWSEEGPSILWRIPIGDGFSSISVANGKIFAMWSEGKKEYLYCLDALTGSKIWQYHLGPVFPGGHGDGPRSSPIIDEDIVYAIGGHGHFHAVNIKNGKAVWSHDLVREYGTVIPEWGYSCSPVIDKDYIFAGVGGKENHAFMAFDKNNGKVIWNSQTDPIAFSSPLIVDINRQRQIIFFSESGLHALTPGNGNLLWHYGWTGELNINIATPLFIAPDKIFISCSYEKGAALIKVNSSEKEHSTQTVWKSKVMRNHFSSSVYIDGYIYGFDNAVLKCIVAETGELKWTKRRLGKGSLIYADGKLIVLSDRGKLVLLEPNPDQYIETASFQVLKGRCWTAPSLSDGLLYLRNRNEMVCLNLKDKH